MLAPLAEAAVTLEAGFWCGPQLINDDKIRTKYGEQCVFEPCLALRIDKRWSFGAEYEFGYDRKGKLGLELSPSTFRMSGADVFIGFELGSEIAALFAKVGLGVFAYKQTVENDFAKAYKVDQTKVTVPLAFGLKAYPAKFFFLGAEIRYVPLKVKPYDYEVDLGGLRIFGGAGFYFNL
jgi:translation elongation factor EF-1beta